MNDLQVKTLTLTPAVVEFNYDELSAVLDENLKKYEGLTFTDKDAAACKKTITELNKGKKSLSDYRIATKKDLTVSVTEFENRCKELSAKFDEAINPLKEQHDRFERDRQDEKRNKILEISVDLIKKEGLNAKYGAQLVIKDEYLTKAKTIKSINEELATIAEHLGIKQDKEEADCEIIKSHVALINERNSLNLIDSTYLDFLDFQPVDAIKERIERDADSEISKRDSVKVVTSSKKVDVTPPVVVEDNQGSFREVYKVTATESQLDALEEYMSSQGIQWVAITDA